MQWPRVLKPVLKKPAVTHRSTSKRLNTSNDLIPLYTIDRIAETLDAEVLAKMGANKPNYPEFKPEELVNYDAFLFGVPTRYGNFPAQWKVFWDRTGGIWMKQGLHGKYAGVFTSTGTPGGGQEQTIASTLSTLTHHGIIFVPLGYQAKAYPHLTSFEAPHGGSPWGAGTFAVRVYPCPVEKLSY
jgi:NAD(P)H dehydrogenase (quinone)